MANYRIRKKRSQRIQKQCSKEIFDLKNCMDVQSELLRNMSEQLKQQQEILSLYYREYQELKKRNEKQHLMIYIRMRDSMLKDMALYQERNQTNTRGYQLLDMYVNEYTEILEDMGVEIMDNVISAVFNPEYQKPVERIDVYDRRYHDVVCKVFSAGYRWNGIMLKKMNVSVGIYKY